MMMSELRAPFNIGNLVYEDDDPDEQIMLTPKPYRDQTQNLDDSDLLANFSFSGKLPSLRD